MGAGWRGVTRVWPAAMEHRNGITAPPHPFPLPASGARVTQVPPCRCQTAATILSALSAQEIRVLAGGGS